MIRALNVDKLRLDMGEYILSVQNLRARRVGRRLLDGVDLDVRRGSCTALIGPAGAGKSLVFACIVGAAKSESGRIRYFGYELRGRAQTRIARTGVIRTQPAGATFGDMTVLDSVLVGAFLRTSLPARARAKAREALALTGLSAAAQVRADALDALDRKRLDLACALATQPQLLLLDDPAAGLSGDERVALGGVVGALSDRGITLVVAARGLDACPIRPGEIVEIERGITAGSPRYATANL